MMVSSADVVEIIAVGALLGSLGQIDWKQKVTECCVVTGENQVWRFRFANLAESLGNDKI